VHERDEVEMWLARAKLGQYKSKLKTLGVKCVSDFAEMEEEDIEAIGFKNKYDQKRFMNALAAMGYSDEGQEEPTGDSRGARSDYEQNAKWQTPGLAMSQGSKNALNVCRAPTSQSNTLDLFHDNWKTVKHIQNTMVYR
jgi:hypothetical protein